MVDIVGKIVGVKIKPEKLKEGIMLKMLRSYGFLQRDIIEDYVKDAHTEGFMINVLTDVVKDSVGKEENSFGTIARRYLKGNLMLVQSFINKMKANDNSKIGYEDV
ncbi:hypothetical protein [Aquimarina longa]|uniref:hypothetical protein n=1 Tax=Aquimarina longa TaxID=1080221 RepID=UPI000784B6F5|nr:hypothetical protein [Aquimarina longa]